ncbi:MAG: glutamate synthase large subunit [Kiritimatiellae bacterium]|nr:glutamate synthase large subunit [Kiritimatiellia bacterium]MDW8458871.1 glutamate synthase large subunit [Verrucomicrobiota bacterium]
MKDRDGQRDLSPGRQGLYSPEYEHDSCGVGMVCNLKGIKSHDVIHKALKILENLSHRGACGCDEKTGDGAGILMQIPDRFLRKVTSGLGFTLPPETEYGAGLVFLPRDPGERAYCMELFERVTREEKQTFLGWRKVPQNNEVLGDLARAVEPDIYQIFIGRGKGIKDQMHFERKLYVIRKVMEKTIRESSLKEKKYFYVPSLSSRTIVYKGLMLADQIEPFLPDLTDPDLESAMALVHQRYSTNTFPTWDLAQPFRYLCHNGEINTLRGNVNWLTARQRVFHSPLFGDDLHKLFPIATPGASDSAILDNVVELLHLAGRSLPHVMSMLIPEAWQNHETMSEEKRAYYEFHACLIEPWDGPASIPFSDGTCVGAVLDRNGLRPSRYLVTKDGFVIMGSETGVLEVDPANVALKGRLQPGRMFLIDMSKGRIVEDDEIKHELASRRPYGEWLKKHMVRLDHLPPPRNPPPTLQDKLITLQNLYGYTLEDLRIVMAPMAKTGQEAVGSMGIDTPLAVLSDRPHLLYYYFKQLFAQVTNPPLDAIREELVTSMATSIGSARNLLAETPEHCHQLSLQQPILTNEDLERIREIEDVGISSITLPMVFDPDGGGRALEEAMDGLCRAAESAILGGYEIIILSDRTAGRELAPIPALLACSGVHHHLIRTGLRERCGLVIESAEPREVHHFACLFGYGASAINPYLAFETLHDMVDQKMIDVDYPTAKKNFIKAINKGVLKVMSKMGISTLQSYKGAQQFEAVGLNSSVIDKYFTWTASRIQGADLDTIAREVKMRHERAYPPVHVPETLELDVGGLYQWRRTGERHLLQPLVIAKLQEAVRTGKVQTYEQYAKLVNDQSRELMTIRGLLEFKEDPSRSIPIEEVEPWTEIVKRFKTGAMSYGSISQEAHETLAIAMNRIGGKSNSGEGGEDEERYIPLPNGDSRSSAIKQVASGRFGVTSHYLANAKELQIKMAQGAKPGEGGQLPAEKVYPWIAKTRHSTPWVQLISPPPHHDIYSIEDLAQLIHDLKNANPEARISVKLVSEVGVGTIAAGVSKGKADVVLISGYDGGTGASPETSLKHAGLPWELGLAETQQTLVLNDLRSRIVVECDGKLMTGRDVAIACLLGAEEFGFSTAPLISLGCIMMRVCHLNTCPVGIATQDPDLRKKFAGTPEHVINFFRFVAEELRAIMARLGYRTVNEMVGQVHRLDMRKAIDHWKAKGIDLSAILYDPKVPPHVGRYCSQKQNHNLDKALDHVLIKKAWPALERGERVEFEQEIRNVNRTVGTMLSWRISKKYGSAGLPEDTIVIRAKGSAGQSFCAFGAPGLTFHVEGDANDYFGKGLSGAKLTIRPPRESTFRAEENIIIGNVAFYGAIKGKAFIRGVAGERFCVRNSGVVAVVEGVGDHGCEYMTGGRVVVLGRTGRNFAAGMSGGIAYVLDEEGDFVRYRLNREMVGVEALEEEGEIAFVRALIEDHLAYTDSEVAKRVLAEWPAILSRFVKVMPHDYKRALAKMAQEELQMAAV